MINYYEGTIFNIDADAYVNAVNTVGFMGKGLALEFALRYPDMLEVYRRECEEQLISIGKQTYYKERTGKLIVNFPTKADFKYPSRIEWIELGLKKFVEVYETLGISSIAFPKLGCSNGGLEWELVKQLMEKYLSNINLTTYVCLDNLPYAEGKEKTMLEAFNEKNVEELAQICRLTQKQKDNLRKNMPYKRFWRIGETEGIGVKTYENLFKYFYEKGEDKQISFFD